MELYVAVLENSNIISPTFIAVGTLVTVQAFQM